MNQSHSAPDLHTFNSLKRYRSGGLPECSGCLELKSNFNAYIEGATDQFSALYDAQVANQDTIKSLTKEVGLMKESMDNLAIRYLAVKYRDDAVKERFSASVNAYFSDLSRGSQRMHILINGCNIIAHEISARQISSAIRSSNQRLQSTQILRQLFYDLYVYDPLDVVEENIKNPILTSKDIDDGWDMVPVTKFTRHKG